MGTFKKVGPGILLCVVVGMAAFGLSRLSFIPLDGVTLAILLGLVAGNLMGSPVVFQGGIKFSEKKVLTWAIALLGLSLDYRTFLSLGLSSLVVVVLSVVFTIGTALVLGRLFKVDRGMSLLIGTGNAVCGCSAIAATQGVIQTRDEYVGVSVATVNLFGTVGIFLIPAVALFLGGFADQEKGVLIGTTLQAVGQVTAAGFSLGEGIGRTATLVKMGRILLLTPLVLFLSVRKNGWAPGGRAPDGVSPRGRVPMVPGYILVFLLLSFVNSLSILDPGLVGFLNGLSKVLLIVAMAGIGMNITFRELLQGGKSALLVGSLNWAAQIAFCVFLIRVI